MKQVNAISGQDLREMFVAATGWLEKSSAEIDALNVFPVPDGDTGINMLLTMRRGGVTGDGQRGTDGGAG